MRKYVVPYYVEHYSFSDKLEEFPLARSVEELDDLMTELIKFANDNYKQRYKFFNSTQNVYGQCLWCTFFKFCSVASRALLKAQKIMKCNLFRLRMKIEDGNAVYFQGLKLTLNEEEVEKEDGGTKSSGTVWVS